MRVAIAQFDVVWEERDLNYETVDKMATIAKARGAQLLVLPEMFATGFSMNPAQTAESADGETATFMKTLAKESDLAILGGLVLATDDGLGQNVALAVDRQGVDLGLYAKTHLFSFMDEHEHHKPGSGPVVFELNGVKCACFICYDLRFPELFRLVADECQVVFVIASWPAARQRHWDVLLPARAVENQLYVVGVNRVGSGGGLDYKGGSAVYSPVGDCLAYGGDRADLFMFDLDPEHVAEVRQQMPFLKDRRF